MLRPEISNRALFSTVWAPRSLGPLTIYRFWVSRLCVAGPQDDRKVVGKPKGKAPEAPKIKNVRSLLPFGPQGGLAPDMAPNIFRFWVSRLCVLEAPKM